MIRREELDEAIAECQGERNPNANTCIKLAAYYTIRDVMYEKPEYSYAQEPNTTIDYQGNTEFAEIIYNKDFSYILPVIEDLVETVKVLLPRVYAGFMRELEKI